MLKPILWRVATLVFYIFSVFALLSLATVGWKLTLDKQLLMVVDALWPVETVLWTGLFILMSLKTVSEAMHLRRILKQ